MKILWAVDIYEKNPKAINASMHFLQALSGIIEINVDAVSVVFPVALSFGSKEALKEKEKKLNILKSNLSKAQKKNWFGKSIVLLETQIPQRVAVLNLTEYAKKNDYDAILLVKHSYKTRHSSYLGSFAEMTSFLSSIPVFLINPDGVIPKKIEKMIVAIDDNSKKEKEFKELVKFFPVKGMNLKIFHRIGIPFYYLLKDSIKQYVVDQKRIILSSFQTIIHIGEKAGGIIELDLKGSSKKVDESILQEAKKGSFELITLIHKRNEVQGFLLGRTTRRILQNADRPVLLFRP